jgi:hypothetical protein
VAQTDQVLDVHHRPGNVHDSNGADAFVGQCFAGLRGTVPGAKAETRMDSAFFNDTIVDGLDVEGVEFTISVPFERLPEFKSHCQMDYVPVTKRVGNQLYLLAGLTKAAA